MKQYAILIVALLVTAFAVPQVLDAAPQKAAGIEEDAQSQRLVVVGKVVNSFDQDEDGTKDKWEVKLGKL